LKIHLNTDFQFTIGTTVSWALKFMGGGKWRQKDDPNQRTPMNHEGLFLTIYIMVMMLWWLTLDTKMCNPTKQ